MIDLKSGPLAYQIAPTKPAILAARGHEAKVATLHPMAVKLYTCPVQPTVSLFCSGGNH
ncbi:hypothetical protein [Litorivivens sp.]|uniref:hypothetical protein n=1 Tax=Litorivivens sp. TaxID=2020868 RepID=UPI00356995FF